MRNVKALHNKSKTHTVILDDPRYGRYRVISGGSKKEYIVNVFDKGASCNCDWATKRVETLVENQGATACSHTIAVFEFIAQGMGKRVSTWATEEEAEKQHRHTENLVDGVVITMRNVPRQYTQGNFFFLLGRDQ